MKDIQKQRLKKIIIYISQFTLLGIIYYAFIKLTGMKLPCISYTIFGFHCPGCGLTRMCIAIIEGDFRLAFRQNMFVFCLLPFIIIWSLYRAYKYIFNEKYESTFTEKIIFIIVFFSAVTFAVLRNLPGFEFLAPIPW